MRYTVDVEIKGQITVEAENEAEMRVKAEALTARMAQAAANALNPPSLATQLMADALGPLVV